MAASVIPDDIMLTILTRLPVKSLLRFISVWRPWLNLFATPDFIKLHRRQFSDDPENQNFMIYSLSKTYCVHTMSLFKIESDEMKPTDLDHPHPEIFCKMDFVGCYNGLICMACPPLVQGTVLWNPAMRMWKFVRPSKKELWKVELMSLGFGYDEKEEDFKVVRIICSTRWKTRVDAEVYSTKSDSWKTIKIDGLQFRVVSSKNDAIVGGDPYWVAKVDKNVSDKSQIVWFDVKKTVFKIWPSSNLDLGGEGTVVPLMDWKGSLATLPCHETRERSTFIHVWVFDKEEMIWNMKLTFGPIEVSIYKCLQCSKRGKIIGVCLDGKLFVFDPESGGVKVIEVEEAQMMSFQIYEYTESLVCIDGMEPMKVKMGEDALMEWNQ